MAETCVFHGIWKAKGNMGEGVSFKSQLPMTWRFLYFLLVLQTENLAFSRWALEGHSIPHCPSIAVSPHSKLENWLLAGTWSLPLPPSVSKESNAVQEKTKIHCNFINKEPLVKGEVEQSIPTGPQWLWINTGEEIHKMTLDNVRQKCSFVLKKSTCLLIEKVDFKSYPHLISSWWF